MPVLAFYIGVFTISFIGGFCYTRHQRNIETLNYLYSTHDMWHLATTVDPKRWPPKTKEKENV